MGYERVETSHFILHRVINDGTGAVERVGFEVDGQMLDYPAFLQHSTTAAAVAAARAGESRAHPGLWRAVALSSSLTLVASVAVNHLWR